MFRCILCNEEDPEITAHKPRDRMKLDIVDCP